MLEVAFEFPVHLVQGGDFRFRALAHLRVRGRQRKDCLRAKADFGEAGMAHVAAVALRAEGRQ